MAKKVKYQLYMRLARIEKQDTYFKPHRETVYCTKTIDPSNIGSEVVHMVNSLLAKVSKVIICKPKNLPKQI